MAGNKRRAARPEGITGAAAARGPARYGAAPVCAKIRRQQKEKDRDRQPFGFRVRQSFRRVPVCPGTGAQCISEPYGAEDFPEQPV